jgi:hypothetical protein
VRTFVGGDEVHEVPGVLERRPAADVEDDDEGVAGLDAQLLHGRELVVAGRVDDLDALEEASCNIAQKTS